jgi:hypothetical protein
MLVDGDGKRRSHQKVDVGEASALARLDPRAVQDTFPQPSPRDLKLHLTLFLPHATTANMAVSTEKISVHSMAGKFSHPPTPIPTPLFPQKPETDCILHRPKKHLRRRHPRVP